MGKTPGELYREREERVTNAIALNIPDRVPVMLELSYFPALYMGIPYRTAYDDYNGWLQACLKTVQDFEPDIAQLMPFFPAGIYESLGPKQIKLPGQGISLHQTHQFLESEYLHADEYDSLLDDRTDFMLRRYLPRIFGALESLGRLPPFWTMTSGYRAVPVLAEWLATPELSGALEALLKAGREMAGWHAKIAGFGGEIEKAGYPLYGVSGAHVPFDFLSYNMRGLQGIYLDMYRQPGKLLEVFDRLLPLQLENALASAKKSGKKRVYQALHRGADGFMSTHQFETFYWPYVKKLVKAEIDAGLTPCLFLEGNYTSRLPYFLELPKGKVLARIDTTDIRKAKEILGGHMCLMGNVPASILQLGTPRDVEDCVKKLIDFVGKGGGFIISSGSSMDEARPENVRRMVDFTKEYGTYN